MRMIFRRRSAAVFFVAGLAVVARAATPPSAKPGTSPRAPAASVLAPGAPVVSVAVVPLTAAEFRPFGEVIELPAGTPPTQDLGTMRLWTGVAKARFSEQLEFSIMTVRDRPRELAEMERHAYSPLFLIALSGEFRLAVAPPPRVRPAGPAATTVKVFLVRPGQAVLLHKGTWHAWPFPAGDDGTFIVASRDGTTVKDRKSSPFRGRDIVKF